MIYEYWCQACGKKWEKQQTIKEMEEFASSCPDCGAKGTRRFSPVNFIIDKSPSISEFNNPKVKDMIPRDGRERKGI